MLSFIIPAQNAVKTINSCLTGVQKQRCLKEVIVICDYCDDKTKDMVVAYSKNIKIYEVKYRSVARTRNFGASVASGDGLVFIDSDVSLLEDYAKEIKEAINAGYIVTGGKKFMKKREITSNINGFIPPANIMAIQKNIFELLSGYRESFKNSGGEDSDFLLRALNNGYIGLYLPMNYIHDTSAGFKKMYSRVILNFKMNFLNLNMPIVWFWLLRKITGLIFVVKFINFFKKNENSSDYR